jgi:hypothetical protein
MAASDKLLEARAELKAVREIIEALGPRVLAGDAQARARLNEALRRQDKASSVLAALEAEDRVARGLPPYDDVEEPATMYGPPPVPLEGAFVRPPRDIPAPMYGPPPVGRGWLARLLGRK